MGHIDTKSNSVFRVENWCKMERKIEHARQPIPFPGVLSYMKMTREVQEFTEYLNRTVELVDKLHDVLIRNGEFEILVSWQGRKEKPDRTWQSIKHLVEHIPGIVKTLAELSRKEKP